MTRLWPKGEAVRTWAPRRGLDAHPDDTPEGFVWDGTLHRIVQVCNRWRVHTLWWEPDQAVWREYLKVTTESGLLCQLYRDLIGGGWYLARLYD